MPHIQTPLTQEEIAEIEAQLDDGESLEEWVQEAVLTRIENDEE